MEATARQLRPRRRSSSAAERFVSGLDVEDVNSLPTDCRLWHNAAIREKRRRLQEAVEDSELTPRVLKDVDTGMPTGRVLVAGGKVHTLYKSGGGYILYFVPASCTVTCAEVGCCDPRRTITAGRL